MSTVFERELLGILSGDQQMIDHVTKSCDAIMTGKYRKIAKKPFLVIRTAGSKPFDIVAMRSDISFPVEVKSSKNTKINLTSGRLAEQLQSFIGLCKGAGIFPIYAYRLKSVRGDSWRVFTLEMEGLKGTLSILHHRLPKLEETRAGNHVMRWKDGMPLHEFIDYLCMDVED